jgi:hypothetical protein
MNEIVLRLTVPEALALEQLLLRLEGKTPALKTLTSKVSAAMEEMPLEEPRSNQ